MERVERRGYSSHGKQEEVLEVMYTYMLENMANEEFEQMQRLIQAAKAKATKLKNKRQNPTVTYQYRVAGLSVELQRSGTSQVRAMVVVALAATATMGF
ncbi:hypothetical protein CFP56_026922 [Quercus suber]|uniref:Uncharacterized protein n=1 Tax=Quercus suber TaxID=58331 RepID=A0AAW0LW80_QUESU